MSYRSKSALPILLLALFISLPAQAQDTKEVSESIKLSGEGRVVIDTYKGSIDIATWDRETVEIEALIEADKDEYLVEYTEVRIHKSGKTLRIESDYERAKKAGKRGLFGNKSMSLPYVHYRIRMPHTADLQIDDYKSTIEINDLAADLDLETYKGEVEIDDVAGEVRIDTYKGRVELTNLAGSLEADTYKGYINAEFIAFNGNSAVDTYRGTVELVLPKSAGFDLNADMGKKGDLDSDFDLDDVRVVDKNRYRGEVGGGGPDLDIDTYRGEVTLAVMR
ncbi:MAG: DUF4097 family beta strand repeat-containing protein [Bacteroidota bacterium]